MNKKTLCFLLALLLCLSALPRAAAAQIGYAPCPEVNYGYSQSVTPGTIRYVCQLPASSLFYPAYWPDEPFGSYTDPSSECSTACISMALSYTGINVLPSEILEEHNGSTMFPYAWGGAEFICVGKDDITDTAITDAVDRYVNGAGDYSPPIIHLPNYSARGHYVLIIGYVSPGVYLVLDPGNSAHPTWTITVDGTSASYNHPKTGTAISDKIMRVHQYRNPNLTPELGYISNSCTYYPAGISLGFDADCIPYTLPCTEQTARAYGCTSEALTDQVFPAGSFDSAVGLYHNSEDEYWYQVELDDGSDAYVESSGVSAYFLTIPWLEDGSFPDCINGPTNLQGVITANGAQIQFVRAYVFPEDSDTPVLKSDLVTVYDTSYSLYQSAVDQSLSFSDLEQHGIGHYRLEIVADVLSYYVDRGTLKTEFQSGFVVDSFDFAFGEPAHSPIPLPEGFSDVPAGSYYADAVAWAVENGITNGTSADCFSPEQDCLRAQVVTFLWRAEGCPEPELRENPFRDVDEDDYYYEAVLWALDNGITTGVSADRFGAMEPCTREQVVTFLYRTMGEPSVRGAECPFTDVAEGAWYEKPILWAVKEGITNGVSADSFGVGDTCTRAQIVTFLYRTYES